MSVERFSGLPAFVRAVEAGSFTAAARALGTTPSAVSKSVARLEKRLGVTLFQRSTRAFVLTREGRTYYERIEPLMRGLEEADEVLTTPATAVGRLRVSLPGDLGRALLEPVTRQLMARNPELALEVSVSDRHVDVIREGFDIAIRAGHAVDSGLYAYPLVSLPLVLVASHAYLREAGTPQTVDDLGNHRHVRYRLNGRAIPLAFADGATLAVEGSFDADSGDAMRIAAVNGMGIAQILKTTVQADLDAGCLQIVLPDVPLNSVPVQALHAFGRSLPVRAKIFIDFIAEHLALAA
ncbi:Transcriptional regulator, LysR family [Paraburkholderia caribensis MBA4]|uniref:Transcriptional regulator, LysR family n=1 Tax=Paraburkholderia caribensis MBA4 TaxID=1323664 RepID=A0A0P0RK29_9BURK|nr:LysR family transcriptional regulator [Paraburkholderia caribensis]ALL69036.1 Transcriptional regulator, LysR family [Paraburkholderia caribensis MBA4]